MNGKLGLFLLFSAFVVVCYTAPAKQQFNRKRMLIHGRPWFGLTPKPPKSKDPSPQAWIASKVDHFDSSNNNTYQQRYWYNNQWYKPGGPVFLMIGGEAAEDPGWLDGANNLVWTGLAQQNGAMTFLIEHRYYGESKVTSDQSTPNLKYLSSRQALADIADFIPAMNTKFNLVGPWVTFGGSYSGALAAWSRMLYPQLIYAAVGSSGPVQAVVDFVGYLEVVHADLQSFSSACANSVQNALAQVQTLIQTANGRQQLFKGFKLCQPIDQTNADQVMNFYSSIIGNYMVVAQYGGDKAGQFYTKYTIPELCGIQTASGNSDLQNMYNVNNWIMQYYSESCVDIDFNDYINYMKTDSDDRAWVYQTCTEFGFYQSTDADNMAFYGNVVTADWYVKQCAEIYGSTLTNSSVYSSIASTNSHYGGQQGYNATRVVLPNGTNDPWHVLGVLTSPNAQATSIIINGTAHCADMYGDGSNDLPSLTAARQQIRNIVNGWFQNGKK